MVGLWGLKFSEFLLTSVMNASLTSSFTMLCYGGLMICFFIWINFGPEKGGSVIGDLEEVYDPIPWAGGEGGSRR